MVQAINERRSIRKFQNKPISEQDIIDILQSGIKAPSSKNRQLWNYIVVQERAKENYFFNRKRINVYIYQKKVRKLREAC